MGYNYAGTSGFVGYNARCATLMIDYSLPRETQFLGGRPMGEVEFLTNRPYPISCAIAVIGWGVVEREPEMHQVRLALTALKLSKPRFAPSLEASEWAHVLQEEKCSLPVPGKTVHIIRDALGRPWGEAVVLAEQSQLLVSRAYIRPITPDVVLVLSLSLGNDLSSEQRTEALLIQRSVLESIRYGPTH